MFVAMAVLHSKWGTRRAAEPANKNLPSGRLRPRIVEKIARIPLGARLHLRHAMRGNGTVNGAERIDIPRRRAGCSSLALSPKAAVEFAEQFAAALLGGI
jgi:hypothetical protein